jgi:hypothetical protein
MEMGMSRRLWTVRLCCCTCCVLGAAALLRGQEPSDAQLQMLADASRARAEGIAVNVAAGGRTIKATVHPNPLMKYTDVPREIEMATLWVWQDEGRPVALGKVEAYRRKGRPQWVYCFASASTGLVGAAWPDGRRFQASTPGIEWGALNGPAPRETASRRRQQLKELFRRFSATARDDVLKTSDELRPLARPLHEYSSPKQGVVQGVVCGFTDNGTNPDVLVALEAVRPAEGKDGSTSWRYGVICMTASGVSVKLDKAEVFTRPYVRSPGDQDKWTWILEGAPRK